MQNAAQNALTSFIVKTMSSHKLVDLINEVREKNGKKPLAHRTFLARVEAHPGIHSARFLAQYKDSTGRTLKCYNLPKREAELMVMSESLAVQAAVYDRLVAELEDKVVEAPTLNNPVMNMIMQQAIQYDKLEQEQKALASAMQEQAAQLTATKDTVDQIALRVGAQDAKFFTVLAYARIKGIALTNAAAATVGRAAVRLSRELGIDTGTVRDERYGFVNTYHEDVLAQVAV